MAEVARKQDYPHRWISQREGLQPFPAPVRTAVVDKHQLVLPAIQVSQDSCRGVCIPLWGFKFLSASAISLTICSIENLPIPHILYVLRLREYTGLVWVLILREGRSPAIVMLISTRPPHVTARLPMRDAMLDHVPPCSCKWHCAGVASKPADLFE